MITRDIVVVGAGVFGTWIAWHLRNRGQSVLLLDAWAPGHSRSSSGGESRIIRMGYGSDAIYTRMAMRSLAQWKELFRNTGRPLFHRTGVLWMARTGEEYSESTRHTLETAGVPIEILTSSDLASRYPQMHFTEPGTFGIFEPESGALMARQAVALLQEEVVRCGGEYLATAVEPPSGSGDLDSVRTVSGERISAGTFVFACGAWLPKLFPTLLRTRIHLTRQEVFFFAAPAGDRRFSSPQLPVWIDFVDPRGPYGFPDFEGRGFKLAFHRHGAEFDPDSGDRSVGAASISEAQSFLATRFPALRDAPLAECRVCQYENTSNGDLLIDRHPDFENVWLAGGGSGHGFKHGPGVGEYVRARIIDSVASEPRFSLATKGERQNRMVY